MHLIARKLLLIALLIVSAFATLAPTGALSVASAPAPAADDYFLYIPKSVQTDKPLQILVTIHGMGGEGKGFCADLLAQAEANGWVVVSPTFFYRDYRVVSNVVGDEQTMMPRLRTIIDELPTRTGLSFRSQVLLYGFSRGAQMVHRFAEWYPEKVLAVALFSAGSYTLPRATMNMNGTAQNMSYPFGIADLGAYNGGFFNEVAFRGVKFFVGVGGADAHIGDVPRDWDAVQGNNRVARATSFYNTLVRMNMQPTMQVFSGVGHNVTPEMRAAALTFLKTQADQYSAWPVGLAA